MMSNKKQNTGSYALDNKLSANSPVQLPWTNQNSFESDEIEIGISLPAGPKKDAYRAGNKYRGGSVMTQQGNLSFSSLPSIQLISNPIHANESKLRRKSDTMKSQIQEITLKELDLPSFKPLNFVSSPKLIKEIPQHENTFVPPPSKVPPQTTIITTPNVYNKLTSVVIVKPIINVFHGLKTILESSTNDIQINADEKTGVINGIVYVSNLGVSFTLSCWIEEPNKLTRIEMQKKAGNSLGFQKFWNEILDKIVNKWEIKDEGKNVQGLIGLFSPTCITLGLNTTYEKEDLDYFNDILIQDYHEPCLEAIQTMIDAAENDRNFSKLLIEHSELMGTLLSKILCHQDITVVRGAIIILTHISTELNEMLLSKYDILKYVTPHLINDIDLIKKYTVRLMYNLSQTVAKWQLTKQEGIVIKDHIINCQNKFKTCRFATKDFMNESMFKKIHTKLVF